MEEGWGEGVRSLEIIELPFPCSNADYEDIMSRFIQSAVSRGIDCIGFGDLYLEDVRNYRLENLRGSGITPLFPLWGMATDSLLEEMVSGGLRAMITCIDPKQTPDNLAGSVIDPRFAESLPDDIDPCGENGEFHSFVFDGPMFVQPIAIVAGEVVHRDGFVFADVLPADGAPVDSAQRGG